MLRLGVRPGIQQAEKNPKPRSGGGRQLTPYQNLLNFYECLQNAYGWTMQEVDATSMIFLLDQMLAKSIADEPAERYIEDVLP